MKEKHLALLDTEEAKLVSQPVLGELGQDTRSSHGSYADTPRRIDYSTISGGTLP